MRSFFSSPIAYLLHCLARHYFFSSKTLTSFPITSYSQLPLLPPFQTLPQLFDLPPSDLPTHHAHLPRSMPISKLRIYSHEANHVPTTHKLTLRISNQTHVVPPLRFLFSVLRSIPFQSVPLTITPDQTNATTCTSQLHYIFTSAFLFFRVSHRNLFPTSPPSESRITHQSLTFSLSLSLSHFLPLSPLVFSPCLPNWLRQQSSLLYSLVYI